MSDDLYRPDVVAGKYDSKKFDPTGSKLLINEVFYSLQGEGMRTGRATIFVRLAKCNLACKFCDTEFETFTEMTPFDVLKKIEAIADPDNNRNVEHLPWIDLTGGEPLLQNCGPLVQLLQQRGYNVTAETSGSVYAEWIDKLEGLTISPKVPKARIPFPLLENATSSYSGPESEVKWIVNATFLKMFEEAPEECFIDCILNFLQPESNNPKWIAAATKLILANPGKYILSLQTHKFANNP